jgi:hypothetical protein
MQKNSPYKIKFKQKWQAVGNLQVGGEDPGEAAENLDGHPRPVQFIATVDQTELGGAKVRLVQHATEQLTVSKMTNFKVFFK